MVSKSDNSRNRKRKIPRGDSPITVGGGGRKVRGRLAPFILITFDHSVYVPDPEDQANFTNPMLTLDPTRVLVNGNPPLTATNPATAVPVNADSEIVIRYKKTGPIRHKIVINGGPFGVSFKAAHLPFDYTTNNTHQATGLEIKKVIIDGTDVRLSTTPPNTIEVHTI